MNIEQSINNENNPIRDLKDIQSIILHHTGSNASDEANKNYLNRTDYISAHYMVGKDGKVYQLMDDDLIAYHAGVSSYKGLNTKGNSLNWNTLGIEVNSNGTDFTDDQRKATKELVEYLAVKYNIPRELILAHKHIAPDRKWDIGENFHKGMSWNFWLGTLDLSDKKNTMTPEQEKLCETAILALGNMHNFGTDDMKKTAHECANKVRELKS
jgi:N-acetyl-anhydromuramyl-L-alanine amidase AmpD